MLPVIHRDLELLDAAAGLVERTWSRRAGASSRARWSPSSRSTSTTSSTSSARARTRASSGATFVNSPLLLVPEVFWDYTLTERDDDGAHARHARSARSSACARRASTSRSSRAPGSRSSSARCSATASSTPTCIPATSSSPPTGRYIALDFGIMGTLTDRDKNYLAQNFIAFFNRDYKRVAQAHVEAGWVPPETRIDEFEAAVRAVCEPIFDRPLKEISFGRVLLRLFQTARRFNLEVQPQLVHAAEDAAQHRGPRPRPRPRPRPVDDREAVPRALDAGADRLARPRPHDHERGARPGRISSPSCRG